MNKRVIVNKSVTNVRVLVTRNNNTTTIVKQSNIIYQPSVSFANQTETNTGVLTDKAISPNTLAGWWTNIKTLAQTFSEKITFSVGGLFSPIATPTHERGRIYFDDANDCLAFMDSISSTSVQVGYEVLMRARNNTGSTITNGSVVYISGAIGQNSTIALGRADSLTTCEIIGVATHDIPNNTLGKVCVFGLANDLDLSAFDDGDDLFLSATTAGALTKTPPASPNFVVYVGVVEHAHPTHGKLLVNPARPLGNSNSLGTSQIISPTQNAVKTCVDNILVTKQDRVRVIASNDTARIDDVLHTVATCTVSDPTPAEGKGYIVRVINGTTIIAGVGYTAGQIVVRTFHSGSWVSRVYDVAGTGGSGDGVGGDLYLFNNY